MNSKKISIENYLSLKDSVQYAPGVGPKILPKLNNLGILTINDLLHYYPRRYLDRSKIVPISQARLGEEITIIGRVIKVVKQRTARGIKILKVAIYDGSSYLWGIWFNQEFHADRLKEGIEVAFSGKIYFRYREFQIQNPAYDILGLGNESREETVHTGRIIPLHPASQSISPNMLRRIMKKTVSKYSNLPDPLPASIRLKYHYLPLSLALSQIHFPENEEMIESARERLVFDELFSLQLGLAIRKKRIARDRKGLAHQIGGLLPQKFIKNLPFELTQAQKRAIREIEKDMAIPTPMNRLLQGEVGSGKTIVALKALLTTIDNGYQGAFMVPTEVLAEQHFMTIKQFLKGIPIKYELLLGAMTTKEKQEITQKIKDGKIDLVIGTHTLIQEGVDFKNLGLAVIDEQHRFGVRQRVVIKEKGLHPDILIMTATPIPRTLSLTLYGDLDISVIDELPQGRKKIKTSLFNKNESERPYNLVRNEIKKGRQAYIVCPLIEESDKMELKSVTEEVERLKTKVFPDFKLNFLHGQMKREEKENIMNKFRDKEIDILVSTTVIEVGIDISNATVMLIEDAERFGLSQLHQLRGRIGRGEYESYCILLADFTTEEARERLKAIKSCDNGFELAEADLRIRGQGELFGTRQSGLTDLKITRLSRDIETLNRSRKEAFTLIDKDPNLEDPQYYFLLDEVKRRFAQNLDWLFHS